MKCFSGQRVRAGNIIIRQVGTKIHPGENVGMGKDYTIYAKVDGMVKFERWGKDVGDCFELLFPMNDRFWSVNGL